jgi:hypothetical protein
VGRGNLRPFLLFLLFAGVSCAYVAVLTVSCCWVQRSVIAQVGCATRLVHLTQPAALLSFRRINRTGTGSRAEQLCSACRAWFTPPWRRWRANLASTPPASAA